jgi:hypothetical protein
MFNAVRTLQELLCPFCVLRQFLFYWIRIRYWHWFQNRLDYLHMIWAEVAVSKSCSLLKSFGQLTRGEDAAGAESGID